jgi:single-strand DNA-binding protein
MYQSIVVIGNVGRDPESRFTPSGQQVTSFSVAVNEKHGETKSTAWFKVSVWGKTAEVCAEYIKKGMLVLVEGRLQGDPSTGGPRVWTGKEGTPIASFEITGNVVKFLSKVDAPDDHLDDKGE